MELGNNITVGSKSVVRITIGDIQVYPKDVFKVSPSYFELDYSSHSIEIRVVSVVGGVATGVTMSVTYNGTGLSGGGYVDGSTLGERVYTFYVPYNDTGNDRQSEIMFRQYGTGEEIYVNVYQDMY